MFTWRDKRSFCDLSLFFSKLLLQEFAPVGD